MFTISFVGGVIYVGNENSRIIDNPLGDEGKMRMFDIMILQSFIMAHLTICIQVNHVTKSKYSPWNNLVNFFVLGSTTVIYGMNLYYQKSFSYSRTHSLAIVIVTSICQWHYILNIIHEISSALEIRILCVKDRSTYISDKIFSDSIDVG